MKKALSIVLALVLCLSMSVMAFAEETADEVNPGEATVGQIAEVEDKIDEAKKAAEDVVAKVNDAVEDLKDNEVVAEAGKKVKSIFSELLNTANDWEGLQAMLSDVNPEEINNVLKTTADSINKLSDGKINLDLNGSLDGLLNGIKGALEDTDLSAGMPAVADAFFAALEKLGVSKDEVIEKLQSSKILNAGAKIYTYGAAPAIIPDNPQTGSTAAIAVFAVLSVAAAVAFVCGKKED